MHGGVEGRPIFMDPRRGEKKGEAQYTDWLRWILNNETGVLDPDRSRCGGRQIQNC
jgi:hypothetical protein